MKEVFEKAVRFQVQHALVFRFPVEFHPFHGASHKSRFGGLLSLDLHFLFNHTWFADNFFKQVSHESHGLICDPCGSQLRFLTPQPRSFPYPAPGVNDNNRTREKLTKIVISHVFPVFLPLATSFSPNSVTFIFLFYPFVWMEKFRISFCLSGKLVEVASWTPLFGRLLFFLATNFGWDMSVRSSVIECVCQFNCDWD